MTNFKSDSELFLYIKQHLYVAAVCDILDELGYRNQAMHQRLRPLLPDINNCGFVGRARTVNWIESEYLDPENPYKLEIEVMDSLRPNDVVVHSTDPNGTNAPWGELMSTVAKQKGAAGCVCDSQIRDCVKIIAMGFPVYYSGIRPLDSKGRGVVTAYDVPIQCGDVWVDKDDLLYADFDGIVVIPKEVENEVMTLAKNKVNDEDLTRNELCKGKSLLETYRRFKAL